MFPIYIYVYIHINIYIYLYICIDTEFLYTVKIGICVLSMHAGMWFLWSGPFINRQAWGVRRMLTVFNDLIRRGHRPRDAGLRSVMVSLGLPVPAEERRALEDPEGHCDDESVDLDENAEEESITEDEIMEEDLAVEQGTVDPAVPGGLSEDMAWHAYIYQVTDCCHVAGALEIDLGNDSQLPPPVLWQQWDIHSTSSKCRNHPSFQGTGDSGASSVWSCALDSYNI